MNGVHDMGGMDGFGAIPREENEPVFHADWERRTFALALATIGGRHFNVDEFRRAMERMPPARYLASSYYERWLYAIESLLLEKGVISGADLDEAMGGIDAPRAGSQAAVASAIDSLMGDDEDRTRDSRPRGVAGLRRNRLYKARFKPGDRVLARNMNPPGHTRIPRYVRGRRGVIKYDWGVFALPDTHADGHDNPRHCYGVEFSARELWGDAHSVRERIVVDLGEDYLERERALATPKARPRAAGALAHKRIAPAGAARTGRKSNAAPKSRRSR
jgi:nitrile hydratase beta subunit